MTTIHRAETRGPEAPTVEDLRRRACTPLAQSLASAFGPGQPSDRFDASMALMEGIAARVCQFLNSLYLHSARDLGVASVPMLDQRLLALSRKNLSFGDYVSAMDLFLSKLSPAVLHPSVGPCWNQLAAPLREQVVIAEDIAELELIKKAREKYAIPVAQLDRYVGDHRTSSPTKHFITSVLLLATTTPFKVTKDHAASLVSCGISATPRRREHAENCQPLRDHGDSARSPGVETPGSTYKVCLRQTDVGAVPGK